LSAVTDPISAILTLGGEGIRERMDAAETRLLEIGAEHPDGLRTIQAGGKRLRPLLVFIAGLDGRESDRLVRGAVAVELIDTAARVARSATTRTRVASVPSPAPPPAPAPAPPPAPPPAPRVKRRQPNRGPSTGRRPGVPATDQAGRTTASLAIAVSPRAVALAVGVALLLVLVVILSTSGGGTPPPARAATTPVQPAPASARLADQLSSLEKVVAHAAAAP